MNPEQKRSDRLKTLNHSIKLATQANGCASLKGLQGIYCLEWGCRKERLIEYLERLEEFGFIKIMDDEITHLHPND